MIFTTYVEVFCVLLYHTNSITLYMRQNQSFFQSQKKVVFEIQNIYIKSKELPNKNIVTIFWMDLQNYIISLPNLYFFGELIL